MIHVDDIGKRYRLGGSGSHDVLKNIVLHQAKRLLPRGKTTLAEDGDSEFWALRNISFDVEEGEVVGIIGRNGAGKSTLLKILSRITAPTEGKIRLRGRTASLLEVGTGFHPELTGRENIFMNGSILGMRRSEIRAKLNEIIEFSEVEKFVDTPVKHFSSGMRVRLAFSVAAHLQPEILIIDEVLAVGDVDFQKKCLGKMGEVARGGRTVLFVSHNMPAVVRLCSRSILLDKGKKVFDGPSEEVVANYVASSNPGKGSVEFPKRDELETAQIDSIRLIDDKGVVVNGIDMRKHHSFEIGYSIKKPLRDHRVGITLYSSGGDPVFSSYSNDFRESLNPVDPGRYSATMSFPPMLINPGDYLVSVGVGEPKKQVLDLREYALEFPVEGFEQYPQLKSGGGYICGSFFSWSTQNRSQGY